MQKWWLENGSDMKEAPLQNVVQCSVQKKSANTSGRIDEKWHRYNSMFRKKRQPG